MDNLSKFLDFLYDGSEGFVYVATKGKIDPETHNPEWNQDFFSWPTEKQKIKDFIELSSSSLDVYIAPALFKEKRSLKSRVKESNVVWVEFDGQEEIDFDSSDIPHPDVIVQTSAPSHVHCYWRVENIKSTDIIDDINRRLTYHLDADSSGWDASQILRPPNSKNWKHNGMPVELKHYAPAPKPFKPSDFDKAPEISQPVLYIQPAQLQSLDTVLTTHEFRGSLLKRIKEENPPVGARSSFLMKVAYELAEEGCNHNEISSVLFFIDERIGKFKGRMDQLVRLSEISSIALLEVKAEEEIVLYSPLDILNHTEELDWILPGWLHHSGFCIVTGAPGSGKTTLSLQLLYHLAVAQSFLGKEVPRELNTLFISLEMGITELKYIFQHHQNGFQDHQMWAKRLSILDQEASRGQYEEVIAELNPSVILIDSLTEFAQQELKEEESKAITRWIKKIRRRYNCAVIAIHHNRKQGQGSYKKPVSLNDLYGSFVFAKDVDTVIHIERDSEDNQLVNLSTLKTRYDQKAEFQLKQDEKTLIFEKRQVNDSGQPRKTEGTSGIFTFN